MQVSGVIERQRVVEMVCVVCMEVYVLIVFVRCALHVGLLL